MNWNNDHIVFGHIPWRLGKLGQSYEIQLGILILQLCWPNYGKDWRIRMDIVSYHQRKHYYDKTIIIPITLLKSLYRNTVRSRDFRLRTIRYHVGRFFR
jgi:hypothetical protein